MNKKILLLLRHLIATAMALQAQPFTLDPRIRPVELKLSDYRQPGDAKPNGRMGNKMFTQTNDTSYYFVKGLSMYSPTYISLNSTSPDADLEVRLCQENWKSFHRKSAIAGQETWSENFKTEGDFGVMVIAKKTPVRYVLLAWTGKELKMELPSVFTGPETATTAARTGWLGRNKLLVVVAAGALLIIGVLVYKLKQKRS